MGAVTAPRFCAMCKHFHTRYNPKHASVGLGLCKLPIPGIRLEKFYPAGAAGCDSYGAGENVAARRSFLIKFQEAA